MKPTREKTTKGKAIATREALIDEQIRDLQGQINHLKSSVTSLQESATSPDRLVCDDQHHMGSRVDSRQPSTDLEPDRSGHRSILRRLVSLLPRTTIQGSVKLRLDPPRR